jgi:cytochrome d ubiquinol oxidase subunit II
MRSGLLWWDVAFCGGSLVAALSQGLILGGLLQSVRVENNAYAGGWWDWLTPFSLFCGVAVAIGYTLLGACWLIWRTEGELQEKHRRYAHVLGIVTLLVIVAVNLITPFLYPQYTARWFSWPSILLTSPVPILVAIIAIAFWRGLRAGHDRTPLLRAELWVVLCFVGLGTSLYPQIVPPGITIYAAAAPTLSQLFLLVGAVVMIPIILAYNIYAYRIFRGKIQPSMHYH